MVCARIPWRMGVVVGLLGVLCGMGVSMTMRMSVGVTMFMAMVPQLGLVE
jgi:hypothetical protein